MAAVEILATSSKTLRARLADAWQQSLTFVTVDDVPEGLKADVAEIRVMFAPTHNSAYGTPVSNVTNAQNATLEALASRIYHVATALNDD